MSPEQADVDVWLRLPMEQPIRQSFRVDLRYSGFEPLPRDRELPFGDRKGAFKQQEMRECAIRNMASHLAVSLLECVESRDTINGYKITHLEKLESDAERLARWCEQETHTLSYSIRGNHRLRIDSGHHDGQSYQFEGTSFEAVFRAAAKRLL